MTQGEEANTISWSILIVTNAPLLTPSESLRITPFCSKRTCILVLPRRVDPSGLTEADLEKIKADSNPNGRSKRSTSKSKGKRIKSEKEKKLDAIPKGTVDEDRIMYWIWGKINPTYMKYISKYTLLEFFDNHPEILHAFKFHPKEYRRVILSMITERHDMLTFDEFDVNTIHAGSHDRR